MGIPQGTLKTRLKSVRELLHGMLPHAMLEIDQLLRYEGEPADDYQYGPRHHPQAAIKGAVMRLRALADLHIDGDVLDAELDSIAREFTADELREIAEGCDVEPADTKWETLANLRAYVKDKTKHVSTEPVDKYEEDRLYAEYRKMFEEFL